MSRGQPGREAAILASIEAEFRDCDPRLLALFDGFDGTARGQGTHRQAGIRWARLLAAPVLVATLLTVLLTAGYIAGCPPVRACPSITGFAGRAVAVMQSHTAQWARRIRAQVCQAVPADRQDACG